MNKKILITFLVGSGSLVFLVLSGIHIFFELLSLLFAIVGSFMGLWHISSLLFKQLVVNNKELLYLTIGTLASISAFGLGRYGTMLFFWLPGTILSILFMKSIHKILHKTSSSIMNPLQEKVQKMEKELHQRSEK